MRLRNFRPSLARTVLAVLALGSFSPVALAQAADDGLVPITDEPTPLILREAPLEAVLQLLEMLTGRVVLRPQNLPAATINLEAPTPLPPEQALLALETVLNMNGIGITPLGEQFIKVVPLANLRIESPELIEGSTLKLPPSGRIASKIFTFQFLRAGEFLPQVASLLNPQLGGATIFDRANAALITDSISTLQRVEMLVNQLDRPVTAGLEPKFYPLEHAKASDLVNKLRTVLQGSLQQQLGSSTTFSADDRTNQVVLIADPRLHAFFDDLIARLDVRADPNTRNEVIALKHAAAPDVANLVSQLVSGQNQAVQRASGSVRPGQVVSNNQAEQPQPTAEAVAAAANELGIASNEFSTFVTILADERSNAVVVSGTVDDIRLIRDLVEKVDVLLAQVRIEVVIVEVTLRDELATGISKLGLNVVNGKLEGFRGTAPGLIVGGGANSDGEPTDFASFDGWDLTGFIELTTTPLKSDANILSVPAIVTTHNKEARIFVGQETPVISGYLNDATVGQSAIGGGYRTTVNFREVGIELKVKPLIGNDGSVQLEISQRVEDLLQPTVIDGNPQPVIGKRETESFISVRNGEVIVLGGLQRENNSRSRSRLGGIPIIGDLLGSRTRAKEKTDLIFFLRPVVLTNSQTDNIEALRRIQGAPQQRAVERALNPDAPSPLDETNDDATRRRPELGPRR